jgi:hypothetical protein
MSILIDQLFKQNQGSQREIDRKWYFCKDICYWSWTNLIDAWRVLIGKSRAFHFKEDEIKKEKKQ